MDTLTKQDMIDIIEGRRRDQRIPNLYSLWIKEKSFSPEEQIEQWKKEHVFDVDHFFLNMPAMSADINPDYCFSQKDMSAVDQGSGLDNRIVIEDWEEAEEFYRNFPDPQYAGLIPEIHVDNTKYVLARWWYCLFERHWALRGMENALMDFYLYPEEVHRLYQKMTDFYLKVMERTHEETCADGFFVSDDIGTQTAPFFSVDIFREFFKPYYKQIFDKAHELNMHFWLHSCGNIQAFLEDFIDIGLDVIHPIQRNTMDSREIAEKYGSRICILAGFDVQHTIPFGTDEEIEEEVRYLVSSYARRDGRFMLTMGNGSTPDWKKSQLEVLFRATDLYANQQLEEFLK